MYGHRALRRLLFRPFAVSRPSSSSSCHALRERQLRALEARPRLTPVQLRDMVADCVRRGDLELSHDLLTLGLLYQDFDPQHDLASYHGLRLLEGLASPKNVERATSLVLALSEQHGKLVVPLLLERLLEVIQETAAEREMDRLLAHRPSLITWSAELLEKTILRVYLRSLQWVKLGRLMTMAMGQGTRLPALRREVWQEIFETALQPPLVDQLTRGQAVLRVTDRNFGQLEHVLKTLRAEGVRLDKTAVAALGAVLETTVVPPEFISYMESMSGEAQ